MLHKRQTIRICVAATAVGTITLTALHLNSGAPRDWLAGGAYAAQKAAPKKPADAAATVAAPESQSAAHARKAGVTACLSGVEDLSRASVAGSYAAVSNWSATAPNDHMFTSIVGQSSDAQVSPKALSVLLTSPQGEHRCDQAAVEIHPSALSCQAIEATLGKPVRDRQLTLSGIPVLQAAADLRYALIPSPGPAGGCVVVGIRTRLAL